ncbi:MAG: hypothetical protein ABIN57_11360 [Chitinophagaceae bacterium]
MKKLTFLASCLLLFITSSLISSVIPAEEALPAIHTLEIPKVVQKKLNPLAEKGLVAYQEISSGR